MSTAPLRIGHGVRTALLALGDPAWLAASREYFSGLGHCLIEADDPGLLVDLARANAVDVALVEAGPRFAALWAELAGRPGLLRRNTCLAAVGPWESLDEYLAFRLGADWVLGLGDAGRAGALLAEMLARQEARRAPWVGSGDAVRA